MSIFYASSEASGNNYKTTEAVRGHNSSQQNKIKSQKKPMQGYFCSGLA